MRTLVTLLIVIPVVVVVMALAVVNNQPVTVALDPFTPQTPILSFTVPLYAVFFGALMLGAVLGGIGTWLGQGRHRKAARRSRREAERWHDEADRLKAERDTASGLPSLPAPRRAA
jgi:Mn2+/Fe2+ NRAMP family transporter